MAPVYLATMKMHHSILPSIEQLLQARQLSVNCWTFECKAGHRRQCFLQWAASRQSLCSVTQPSSSHRIFYWPTLALGLLVDWPRLPQNCTKLLSSTSPTVSPFLSPLPGVKPISEAEGSPTSCPFSPLFFRYFLQ